MVFRVCRGSGADRARTHPVPWCKWLGPCPGVGPSLRRVAVALHAHICRTVHVSRHRRGRTRSDWGWFPEH